MIRTTTTTTKSTTTIVFDRSPSTTCSGFTDIHGTRINGFACPIENLIQYFCCGTDTRRYCCPPDRYSFETKFYIDSNNISDYSDTYNNIVIDESNTSLINYQKMITKQFQQFQRYFLPAFLLTTTILFLVGIALWFWLYKHKLFYSLGQDDFIESRTLKQTHSNSMEKKRKSINLTLEHKSRLLKHLSTEV